MRVLEKYAVLCGGGTNHRIDLASGILIKNNHISLGGGIPTVLARALERRHKGQRIQVEVRTPQELEEALSNGAEAILLDNMTPKQVKQSVERITRRPQRKPSTRPRRRAPLDSHRSLRRHRPRKYPRLRRNRRRLHLRRRAHPLRQSRRHLHDHLRRITGCSKHSHLVRPIHSASFRGMRWEA